MNLKKNLCLLLGCLCCLCVAASEADWRKIENSLYSLELPASWVPMNGMPGDGTIPGEREVRGYHLHYFAWQTPVKSQEDIPDCMGIDIQTYQKTDKSPLSVKDIEEAVIIPAFKTVKEISSSGDGLRGVAWKDSKEMDGSIVKYRVYYLLRQAGAGMVHCVQIDLRDERIKNKPDTEKVVKRILDSFTPKGGVLPASH